MAKPKSRPQMSLESAHVADDGAGIPPDHWCRHFFALIYCAFDDAQFAHLYQDGGRYPISPALLAAITILQYLFKVSDRMAVEHTVMRRDWRIALGRDKQWAGFCPTVLVDFRQRLRARGQERLVFETVLDKVRELGLLKGRRRVRVDATRLVADVARLSRADALQEAIRVVVSDLHKCCPALHERPDFSRLYEQYGEEVWLGMGSNGSQRLSDLGRDGQAVLELCGSFPARGKEVLAQMLSENFIFDEAGEPQVLEGDQRPPDHIVTPHEPDVRVGRKGDELWWGDKVHIIETADEGRENFIVDVVTTDPRVEDSTQTADLAQRAKQQLPEAETLVADGGYASAANTEKAAEAGLDLVTRPRPNTRKGQFPADLFELDFARRIARCPGGHESAYWRAHGRELTIRFRARDCAACPLRTQCTTSKCGRSLGVSKDYEQLQRDRERAATPEHAEEYRHRAPVEATFSELVRCCGLRRSRYRRKDRRAHHALFAATALNVRRLLQCLARPQGDQEGPDGALAAVFARLCGAAHSASRALRAPTGHLQTQTAPRAPQPA